MRGRPIRTFIAMASLAAASMPAHPADSTINGDFDGDGLVDRAVLVERPDRIMLKIQRGAVADPEVVEFGVDPARQDAVCRIPARLEVAPVSCTIEDGPLPGCRERPGQEELAIHDDACDGIHLYWNDDEQRMAWWRR